jgi:hypothetical protein
VLSGLVGRDDSKPRSTRSNIDPARYTDCGELGDDDITWLVVEVDQRWSYPDGDDREEKAVEAEEVDARGV